MTRAATPPLLAELQHESPAGQVAALRALKHEIVGHDQRKEAWISWGIVPIVARVLRRGYRKKAAELNGTKKHVDTIPGRTDEEEACHQAIIIVGSLSQGGPPFISPLLEGDVLPSMLAILSSPECPEALALSILTALDAIADRLPLQNEPWPRDNQVAELLFSKEHIGALARIISETSTSRTTQSSITLAAGLIAKLCTEESQKAALADAGVLDALAIKVASFVVSQGFVLPGAELNLREPGMLLALPPPAPPGARLAPILRSVTIILEHSKWRAEHFLSCPAIVTVLPKQRPEFSPSDIKKAPWGSTYLSGSAVPRLTTTSSIEQILPALPLAKVRPSASFPPLVSHGWYGKHGSFLHTPLSPYLETGSSDEDESPLVPWLLCVARGETGMARLMAARLVMVLFRLGLAKKHRIAMFSYFLLPMLLRMLDKDYDLVDESDPEFDGLIPSILRIKEEAPAVLASLVMDTQELQKHAVDGGAIKKLSQLLKETYNPLPDNTKPMWHPEGARGGFRSTGQPELRLGPPGYSPTVCHIMRYRESILRALAALAPFKDEYRKAICDHGVVPYIIDSLKPRPSEPSEAVVRFKNTVADGNPIPTLLAACGAARTLTRSVSVLRTSLIDAGVTKPLFELIRHSDMDVQIAATSVICNLVLDFSPMKEAIISAQILPTLCEHAHSSNIKLRLESLWALKHVTYNSTNDVKIKVIEALQPEWLKQIISQDPTIAQGRQGGQKDIENGSPLRLGSSNSAGERVDLLNPIEDTRDREDDLKMGEAMPTSRVSLDMYLPHPAQRRKLALSGDLDQTRQARQDDIAVQEQIFDLIRNIICGQGAPEMIDYLFQEIGSTHFLDILADKLRPRTIQVSRREPLSVKSVPVPLEILISVTYLIIHLAAGLSRHRQQLILHRDLLKSLMNFFNHSDRLVRVNCVWVVINLTDEDDQNDRSGCQTRALKLQSLGVMDRLTSLEDDPDLDVRERTKTAVHLMRSLVSM